jgi:hypothetical protein
MTDYRLMLARLRPTSEYHWRGGADDDYSAIGEWRDPNTTKPTKAQLDAEWAAYQQEQADAQTAATNLRNQIITIAQSAVGVRVDQLTAAQVRALNAIELWQKGALNNDLTVKPLAQWVR